MRTCTTRHLSKAVPKLRYRPTPSNIKPCTTKSLNRVYAYI